MAQCTEKPGEYSYAKWDGQQSSADEIVTMLDNFLDVTGHEYQILENGDLDILPGPGFAVTVPVGRTVVVGPKWGSTLSPQRNIWMLSDEEYAERFDPAP